MLPFTLFGVARGGLRGFSISSRYFVRLINAPVAAVITMPTLRRFSSSQFEAVRAADENLSRLLQAEINAQAKKAADRYLSRLLQAKINAQAKEAANRGSFVPENFPFEIIDNLGENYITLKRNDFDEEMWVTVIIDDDYWSIYNEKKREDNSFDMYIKIYKEDKYLQFSAFSCSSGITFYSLSLKPYQDSDDDTDENDGPELTPVEESLDKATTKYLEARGLDGSLVKFLEKYFSDKREREYFFWLKNIVDFIMMP